ncbi:hypothetical protein R1sor_024113 [Riccia sorocarpa]|uniref:Uncharacterized protein n=1 Tax=Riccia sorocarpa TaxID=122646 RepID=A0ABD3GSK2_9MARC
MSRPKMQARKRKGKEKLPIIEFPPDDAAEEVCETISNFIQDVGDEEGTSKRQKVDNPGSSQVPQSTALELYRAHDQSAIQLSSGENTILTFEELAMLTRNEVFPFLNLDRLEDEGIVEIDPNLFGPGGGGDTLKVNISEGGLREQLQFRNSDDSDRVVPPLAIENEFLQRHRRATLKDAWKVVAKWFNYTGATFRNEGWYIDDLSYFASIGRADLDKKCKVVIRHALRWVGRSGHAYARTGLVLLAIAQVHPGMGNSRPDWHAWVHSEIKFRLNHHKDDKFSSARFREGWQAIVELLKLEFRARQQASVQQPQMLQIEARNAFEDTKVVWDSERGELIAEQERLKSALQEVQQREEALRQEREELQGAALEASLREEALRKEHESLQQEYSRQKDEWEAKNQKLSEEIEVLHEDRKRITSKAENVEAELGRIRSHMEAQNPSEDMGELKRQLLQKEE